MSEAKKPLPLVSAIVERMSAGGPHAPVTPLESEPIQVVRVEAHGPPPFAPPMPGQMIGIVEGDRIVARPAPISRGATLTEWTRARGGENAVTFTYSDSSVLWFDPSVGSRGAFRVLHSGLPPPPPPLPSWAPQPPRAGDVVDFGPGEGPGKIPEGSTFLGFDPSAARIVYKYRTRDGREIAIGFHEVTGWSDLSSPPPGPPPEPVRSGFRMRSL